MFEKQRLSLALQMIIGDNAGKTFELGHRLNN